MENCFEDLVWRGLIKDTIGDVKTLLNGKPIKFYVGIDCTGNGSGMHVGHLMAAIVSKHLQRYGHTPILIKGIATALCGDPSGRDTERPEISYEQVMINSEKIESQLKHILGDDVKILNNNDWMSKMSYIDFMREMGKVITLNQMLTKTAIKSRIEREQGVSIQEATYMLLQGYDALHLFRNEGVTLEIGGGDQWANIEIGVEAVRKKEQSEFYGLTWDLIINPITGKKFGKTADGKSLWLDKNLTSPFDMYQFFINVEDSLAKQLIKKFTFLSRDEIESLIAKHDEAPHLRLLQKTLAFEVTKMVHSEEDANMAIEASKALFDKNVTIDTFKKFDENTFKSIFDGVAHLSISKDYISSNPSFIDFAVESKFANSKGEIRRAILNGGISKSLVKIPSVDEHISFNDVIHDKYIILKSGKKYSLVTVE